MLIIWYKERGPQVITLLTRNWLPYAIKVSSLVYHMQLKQKIDKKRTKNKNN